MSSIALPRCFDVAAAHPAERRFAPDRDDPRARRAFVRLAALALDLPPREAEVLYHLCRGLTSNKEIAGAMGLRPQTVKNFKTAILRATGAGGTERLVLGCWRLYRAAVAPRRAA